MLKVLCGLLTGGLFLAWASMAQADDMAKAIIEKAIKAHGGEKNLAKLRVRHEKTKDTHDIDGLNLPYTSDYLVQLPDRMRITYVFELEGKSTTNIFGFNGDKTWYSYNGKVMKVSDEVMKEQKDLRYADSVLTLTPLLKDKGITLSPLGEIKVNERPALGVRVSAKDRKDVNLYFDKETRLLVKSEFRAQDPSTKQEANMATLYSDYKETDGLKWPMKTVQYWDEKRSRETEITELKFLDKIDESEFAKP